MTLVSDRHKHAPPNNDIDNNNGDSNMFMIKTCASIFSIEIIVFGFNIIAVLVVLLLLLMFLLLSLST